MTWKAVLESYLLMSSHPETYWIDILPPEPPVIPADLSVYMVFLIVVASAIAGVLFVYNRPGARAKRTLILLKKNLSQSHLIDSKVSCSQIYQCLRLGLGNQHLKNTQFIHQSSWKEYLKNLDRCRYSNCEITAQDLDAIIDEALLWLNTRPLRRCCHN
jgi:hypothetical protein